jgi:bacteriocin-like protein
MKKNLDLNAYGVKELNVAEMQQIEGGSIWSAIGDAVDWVGVAARNAYKWCKEHLNVFVDQKCCRIQ